MSLKPHHPVFRHCTAQHGEQVVVDIFDGRIVDRFGSRRDNVARLTGATAAAAAAAGGMCVRVDKFIASERRIRRIR